MPGPLKTRLAKLEKVTKGGSNFTVMFREPGETQEQAVDRWKHEHPGQDPGPDAIVIQWV